jgi:hypothetical protein
MGAGEWRLDMQSKHERFLSETVRGAGAGRQVRDRNCTGLPVCARQPAWAEPGRLARICSPWLPQPRPVSPQVFHRTPLIVTDYPRDIKAFYMRANDDGATVAAMDLLVPR